MISVRKLVKHYDQGPVVNNVSLSVQKGEVAVLIGPSGCGKSTLLRCLNGLETFQAGEVQIGDLTLTSGDTTTSPTLLTLRRRIGMVFQQFHLFPHLTAVENIMAGPLWVLGQKRAEAEPEAWALLKRVGLEAFAGAKPERLSGGQQQRVAIARALAMKPAAVLFDEPTSALDPQMASEVLRVMADLAQSGQTMVVVTHAMGFARKVAHNVHVMYGGQIIESGSPEQVFEKTRDERTQTFLAVTTGV